MISDGAGYNTFDCASYYQHGSSGQQVYDKFPVKLGCTTYSLDNSAGYDPQDFWSDFKYGRRKPTDSAASATAINTGVKTRNGRICTDSNGNELTSIAQIADSLGKAVGTVSSVQFTHATPAAVWAHNKSRDESEEIAGEMICESGLDVIMGCGHPKYNNNGSLVPAGDWEYESCGGKDLFAKLLTSSTGQGWTFIDSRFDFEALASSPEPDFERVIGIAQCRETLQFNRRGGDAGNPNINVPNLVTMTKAALNVLAADEDGFYLMIEGGAVDWANHDNNLERMIEEQIDFNNAIEAVVQWVYQFSSWDQTLLIITADHETGQLWGPKAGSKSDTPFDLPKNKGKGILPGAKYFSEDHTNALVPLYAIGAASGKFKLLIDGTDFEAAKAWNFSGEYVDNTDIFSVMQTAISVPAKVSSDKH
jgi:alkaline phosphatase